MKLSGANVETFLDNVSAGSVGGLTVDLGIDRILSRIGDLQPFHGEFRHFSIVRGAITAQQITDMEAYCATLLA